MRTLVDIINEKNLNNVTHPEFGTDKEYNHMYCTAFYDKEFVKYTDRPIKILEIGIARGGSLVLWHEYFPNAELILGVDIRDQGAKQNTMGLDRIEILLADGYRKDFSKTLTNFDIIIEDGPHTKESQIQAMDIYLDKLNKGGVFIIEDITDIAHTEEFKLRVPANMTYEIVDARNISPDSDSILFIVRN